MHPTSQFKNASPPVAEDRPGSAFRRAGNGRDVVRIGAIGTGGYAVRHLTGLHELQREGLVTVSALADPFSGALQSARELFPAAATFSGYRELLDFGGLDGVIISAPVPCHEEMTLAALSRDLPVLLEKPPVPLMSQLERLIAADPAGRVMVGFQHIYSHGLRDLKQRILAGEIGCLETLVTHGLWPRPASYYARATWAGQLALEGRPVLDGPCTNGCAHFLNDLLFLAGDSMRTHARPYSVSGELYRTRSIGGYDTGLAFGSLASGVRFFGAFSHASRELREVKVVARGDRGECWFDELGNFSIHGRQFAGDDGRDAMRRAFLDHCRGDREANFTPLKAMRGYLLLSNMMCQSAGGISPVPPEAFRIHRPGTPEEQTHIVGLGPAMEAAAKHGASLAASGLSWARENASVFSADFSEDRMLAALGMPPSAVS